MRAWPQDPHVINGITASKVFEVIDDKVQGLLHHAIDMHLRELRALRSKLIREPLEGALTSQLSLQQISAFAIDRDPRARHQGFAECIVPNGVVGKTHVSVVIAA
ncbi:hypothetical protein D3C79_920960 [compost metagenome]